MEMLTFCPPVLPRLAISPPSSETICTLGGRSRNLPVGGLRQLGAIIENDAASDNRAPDAGNHQPIGHPPTKSKQFAQQGRGVVLTDCPRAFCPKVCGRRLEDGAHRQIHLPEPPWPPPLPLCALAGRWPDFAIRTLFFVLRFVLERLRGGFYLHRSGECHSGSPIWEELRCDVHDVRQKSLLLSSQEWHAMDVSFWGRSAQQSLL